MNSKHYITAIAYIIFLRIADLAITFIYTPYLRYEWNPVVSVFNYSWIGMMLTQVVAVGFIISMMYFYFSHKPASDIPSDLTFWEYIYFYFHNEKKTRKHKLVRFNKKTIRKILAYNGFILMILVISISYLAIINNLLVIYKMESYSNFIAQYQNYFYPAVMAILAIASWLAFFLLEYRKYHAKTQKPSILATAKVSTRL